MAKLQQNANGSNYVTLPMTAVTAMGWKKGIDLVVVPTRSGFFVKKAVKRRR